MSSETPFFFTWTAQRDAHPLEINGGEGVHFTCADGSRWLDFGSLSYQLNVGHGHARMVNAVREQASRLCVSSPSAVYPEKTRLASKLLELAPEGFSKVFFTLGGAEATENAIKMARMYTGKHKLVSRYRSYHGATLGALTLSGDYRRPPLEPGIAGVTRFFDEHLDAIVYDRDPGAAVGQLDRILRYEGSGSVSAVVLETIPGANGVLVADTDYWKSIREACDAHGALLVLDEVLTGFGRTGQWFAFDHYGVTPDLITVGKALTGGYGTLGAVLVHDRIAKYFDEHTLYAGLTHYAHPLGVAAALEAISVYQDEKLIENAAQMESELLDGLERITGGAAWVRGRGLLAAAELRLDREQWSKIAAGLRERHVHAHVRAVNDCLIVAPPLCVTAEQIDEGLATIQDVLKECL